MMESPRPSPIAMTKGTVIGPVVTPAESHATQTYSSDEMAVSISAIEYLCENAPEDQIRFCGRGGSQ